MGKRGRESSAAAELAHFAAPLTAVARPDAPYDLTDEAAEEWRAVVNRMPADWFPRETWPLLAQYCRHVVAARRVAKLVEAIEREPQFDIVAYDRALKMQEREGRAVSSLATRMRVSQQATYDKSKKKGGAFSQKPWE